MLSKSNTFIAISILVSYDKQFILLLSDKLFKGIHFKAMSDVDVKSFT